MIRSTSVEVASARANAGSAYAATRQASGSGTANRPQGSPEQQRGEDKVQDEASHLLKQIPPLLLTNVAQALLPITSFGYAGRLTDSTTIAGLGLGISICNITGL